MSNVLEEAIDGLAVEIHNCIAENKRLIAAIVAHRDQFPDEPMSGELELWKVLENA